MLSQLVYCSRARQAMDAGDLIVLLDVARSNNEQRALTGMLLYSRGVFLQLLEGPATAVDEVFDRISSDPRHDLLGVLVRDRVERRHFEDWAMGFEDVEATELERYLPGYVPPPTGLGDVATDDATVARRLLRAARGRDAARTALPVG